MRPIPLILLLSLFSLLTFITGCGDSSSSTDSGQVEITGSIEVSDLRNDPDFSTGMVAVYHPVTLPQDLTAMSNTYPQIGVSFSQELYFDHREQAPVETGNVSNDGSFSISVDKGIYNIAVVLPGYGYQYDCLVDVSNQGQDLGVITLHPVTVLPDQGISSGDIVFRTGYHYVVEDVFYILETDNLTIESGSRIHIAPNGELMIMGGLSTPSSGVFHITSSDGMDLVPSQPISPDPYGYVQLDAVPGNTKSAVIRNGVFSHGEMALRSKFSTLQISECLFRNHIDGLGVESNVTNIDHCTFTKIEEDGGRVMNNLIIGNCVFYDIQTEGFTLWEGAGEFHDNLVYECGIGLRVFYGDYSVHHNHFENNSEVHLVVEATRPDVQYNEFYGTPGVKVEFNPYYVQGYTDVCTNPVVSYNNFWSNQECIDLIGDHTSYFGDYTGWGVDEDIATNHNYFSGGIEENTLIDGEDIDWVEDYRIHTNPTPYSIETAGIR